MKNVVVACLTYFTMDINSIVQVNFTKPYLFNVKKCNNMFL